MNEGLTCFMCPQYKLKSDDGIKIVEMFLLEKCLMCRKVNPQKFLDKMLESGIIKIGRLNDLHKLNQARKELS